MGFIDQVKSADGAGSEWSRSATGKPEISGGTRVAVVDQRGKVEGVDDTVLIQIDQAATQIISR